MTGHNLKKIMNIALTGRRTSYVCFCLFIRYGCIRSATNHGVSLEGDRQHGAGPGKSMRDVCHTSQTQGIIKDSSGFAFRYYIFLRISLSS